MILETDAKRPSSVACYEGEVLCIAMYFVGVRQFAFPHHISASGVNCGSVVHTERPRSDAREVILCSCPSFARSTSRPGSK